MFKKPHRCSNLVMPTLEDCWRNGDLVNTNVKLYNIFKKSFLLKFLPRFFGNLCTLFGFSALIESCKTRTLGVVILLGAFSIFFPSPWLSIFLICFDLRRIHQTMHREYNVFTHAQIPSNTRFWDSNNEFVTWHDLWWFLPCSLLQKEVFLCCFYTFATVEPNGYEVWWLQDGALLLPGMSEKPLERSQAKMSTKTLWDSIRHKTGDVGSEDGMSYRNYCWWDLDLLVLDGFFWSCLLV